MESIISYVVNKFDLKIFSESEPGRAQGVIGSAHPKNDRIRCWVENGREAKNFSHRIRRILNIKSMYLTNLNFGSVTYVERLPQVDPARLGLDVEVVEVGGVDGRRDAVADGAVVVGVLVRRRHAQDVGAGVRVLLHVLDVFLKPRVKRCILRSFLRMQKENRNPIHGAPCSILSVAVPGAARARFR